MRSIDALGALLLVPCFAACSANPTAQEVVDRSTPAICKKAQECAGEATFAVAYPGGVDECVTKTKAETEKKYGDDLEASSVCTDEEVDSCLEDLAAAECPADKSLPQIPCKC